MPDPNETVEVPVSELRELEREYQRGTDEGCSIRSGWGDSHAIEALIARIPEPPWEPDPRLVEAAQSAAGRINFGGIKHRFLVDWLKSLHADGYELRPIGVPDA